MSCRYLLNLPASLLALAACGTPASRAAAAPASDADGAATYAPLDVGADYRSYHKVTKFSHPSRTHGGRLVDIWVNDIGYAAYIDEDAEIPAGTIIVKTSWEVKGGKRTGEAGPIFVMEKRATGYDPDHDDWYYAMHWEDVPQRWRDKVGGAQVYWRSPSPKVVYCWKCHENYLRDLGMPAREARAW
jgi:hypothetical protein